MLAGKAEGYKKDSVVFNGAINVMGSGIMYLENAVELKI